MTKKSDWVNLISGNDVIVNCAGALQDGLADNLTATQQDATRALYEASQMAGGRLIVQISARTSGAACGCRNETYYGSTCNGAHSRSD
ncbi:hypothetical protein [Agrobacterium rosae]|uniref:hypothetical protein n=1 Tax=Agrobacterium rosae TaxID=1972867 RepID=UPI003A7FCCC1